MKQLIASIIILVTIIAAYLVYRIQNHPYHFRTVIPGTLYRSGTLTLHEFQEVYKHIKLKSIIDLRSEKELTRNQYHWYTTEKNFAKKHRIRIFHIKMKRNTPPTSEQIKHFFKIMDNSDNFPVLIHCEEGVDRTGMMVAIYKIYFLHETNKMVFRRLPMFGHSWSDKKTEEQFILNFNPTCIDLENMSFVPTKK